MDQVSEVRSRIDIAGLIQEYLPLKKSGRNFKANCPFHNETSPSFVVSPERQIWHCFGCNKGGDCFTFLMDYEHIEFPEALRMLADKAGVVLKETQFDKEKTSKKERLYTLNHLAAEFYHYLLTSHDLGKDALLYLQKRGVKPQTMKTFLLGYAPKTSSALVTYLIKKKGYSSQDIIDAGLGTMRNGRVVDFFFDRLMFALCDHRDNIIGFSGRILTDRKDTSKYINTRDTLIYHKGLTFFGFNIAKEAVKKENQVILMEGEFDVISSFQEGITNAVAVKGTALTEDQVNLLSRFTHNIAVCFDMDNAGQMALKRSIPLLEKKGINTSVILVPEGKDADEALKTNPSAFKQAVKKAQGVYDFLLTQASKNYDPKSAEGKKAISDDILPVFADIENEIVKDHYLHQLADLLGASEESLLREIEKRKKMAIVRAPVASEKQQKTREERLEEYLTALLLQSSLENDLTSLIVPLQTVYVWAKPSYEKIITRLRAFWEKEKKFDQKAFAQSLPEELIASFDEVFLLPIPSFEDKTKYEVEIRRVVKDLQGIYARKQIKIIGDAIKQGEKEGTVADLQKLQEQLSYFVGLL
ncbi:MAG TPA: DNA primase [Patescibacteria group bacterium]|nr:DNA primase [Patescibacteria group bacterium]